MQALQANKRRTLFSSRHNIHKYHHAASAKLQTPTLRSPWPAALLRQKRSGARLVPRAHHEQALGMVHALQVALQRL